MTEGNLWCIDIASEEEKKMKMKQQPNKAKNCMLFLLNKGQKFNRRTIPSIPMLLRTILCHSGTKNIEQRGTFLITGLCLPQKELQEIKVQAKEEQERTKEY
jgi:hypothetical protein